MVTEVNNTWGFFKQEFQNNILLLYEEHEKTFDFAGIHGRMHISRALIFAEFMSRFYTEKLNISTIDYTAIRYAISFHDSGRKGNGKDIWEEDSAKNCERYLLNHVAFTDKQEYCAYVGSLIHKHGQWDLNKKIVHDADVLEIMRPCCGHGSINGFQPHALRFLSDRDDLINPDVDSEYYERIRKQLINEAWALISYTEQYKTNYIIGNHIESFLDIIKTEQEKYQLLNLLN